MPFACYCWNSSKNNSPYNDSSFRPRQTQSPPRLHTTSTSTRQASFRLVWRKISRRHGPLSSSYRASHCTFEYNMIYLYYSCTLASRNFIRVKSIKLISHDMSENDVYCFFCRQLQLLTNQLTTLKTLLGQVDYSSQHSAEITTSMETHSNQTFDATNVMVDNSTQALVVGDG